MKAFFSIRRVLPLMTVILLVGLLGLFSQRLDLVHAATTITVTSCPNETTLLGDIASAGPGGTVRFSIRRPCIISINPTLVISQNLTLDNKGQRVTLDGGSAVQVLHVNPTVTFTLNAFTVANGVANKGGGLDSFGTVTISKSIFDRNSAGSSGTGGGIENETGASVTISNSTFTNNSAGNGGGLDNNGTVTISNSTFANSTSNGSGGGIENESLGSTVTISNSTFANNAAFGSGGGLDSAGTVTISNSTFDHNTAIGGSGGGLSNSGSAGTVTIKNSTFANNSASGTGGVGGGGIDNEPGNTVQIAQSIVANNSAPTGPNCKGVITDQGYNLESGNDCGFVATTDRQNTNPLLGPLANNGGPTQTLALQHGSPAIDKIPVALCPGTDQRGFKRPDDTESVCDIGAFESRHQG
jgi:Right handed beta helix region